MGVGLSGVNRAFNLVPKRAESRQSDRLRDTFVDSGVAAALEAIDHQILYGRRGTGKTHAFRYLENVVRAREHVAVYIDLRTMGSPEGLFLGETLPPTERAGRLLVDLLGELHDALLEAALEDDTLMLDVAFVTKLDGLAEAISTVRIAGEVELSTEGERKTADKSSGSFGLTVGPKPSAELRLAGESSEEGRRLNRETRRGNERVGVNFSQVARALRELADTLSARRLWLLLDEWSSVPPEIQPYLAEFLVRCVLPLQMFTVKIAAIEQQTRFRFRREDGTVIGIELGADVAANVDLDEFMVFEQNQERAREFFRGLLFKHLTSGVEVQEQVAGLRVQEDLIRLGFTDKRAFDELVRAAEGVPRDAINIAAKAALRAGTDPISVPHIRQAARAWFQTDKEAAIRSHPDAQRLLNWVIDKVIKQKRARGFLVNQKDAGAPLMLALFDARVLHLVRRGYSAQDEPGERYDVYVIDYGAYVDLIHTKYEPLGVLPVEDADAGYVEVPTQDLRAIRRAILDLAEFDKQASTV
ncbi:ORC-CDC6 family AAA ATPase [Micromonospora chersina]|uniref:ORC-CDC6 family AAA ATPase n=1 Tax=Micromonospora chersina TaxID=47854 RepID=UPI00371ABF8D